MEKLKLNGKEVRMASLPLDQYFEGLKEKSLFSPTSTACWRGYVGTWEIEDAKLYLIEFEGNVGAEQTSDEMVGMIFLFHN